MGESLTSEQITANRATGDVRATLECMYIEVKLYLSTTNFKRNIP